MNKNFNIDTTVYCMVENEIISFTITKLIVETNRTGTYTSLHGKSDSDGEYVIIPAERAFVTPKDLTNFLLREFENRDL